MVSRLPAPFIDWVQHANALLARQSRRREDERRVWVLERIVRERIASNVEQFADNVPDDAADECGVSAWGSINRPQRVLSKTVLLAFLICG